MRAKRINQLHGRKFQVNWTVAGGNRSLSAAFLAAAMGLISWHSTTSLGTALTWDDSGANPAAPTDGFSSNWDTTLLRWSNGISDAAWNNANNDIAVFGSSNGTAGTVNLGSAITVNGITFNAASSGNYTIAGNTLTLAGATPTITTNVNATINSVIAGSGVILTKAGAGTLTVDGINTYSGGTIINAGTLSFSSPTAGSAGAMPAGSITIKNGATLQYTGAGTGGFNRAYVFDAGTITIESTDTSGNTGLNASGAVSFTGSGTRTLVLKGASASASFTNALGDGAGGATSLVKQGAGTWVLGAVAASTYTGSTDIQAGILSLARTNALPTGTALSVAGTLRLNGNDQAVATLSGAGNLANAAASNKTLTVGSGSFSGVVSDGGVGRIFNLAVAGPGTLVLSGASNSYTGNTSVNGGTLQANSSKALGFGGAHALSEAVGTTSVAAGATLDLNGAVTVNEPISLSGGSLINSNTGAAARLDNGIAAITFTSGGSGYSGTITVAALGGGAAATAAQTSGAISSVTMTAAGSSFASAPTVTINGSTGGSGTAVATAVLSSLTLSGTSNNIGGDGNLTIAAAIGGVGGGFTKSGAGTLSLSAVNTYTGSTTVGSGALDVTSTGKLGIGNVLVSGATSILELDNATSVENSSALTLTGGGTVNLNFSSGLFETVGALTFGGNTYLTGSFNGSSGLGVGFFTGTGNITATPEPSSLGLLALGGMGMLRRRRSRMTSDGR